MSKVLHREYFKRVSASYILLHSLKTNVLSDSINFTARVLYKCVTYIMDILFGSVYEEMRKSEKNETMTKRKTEKEAKKKRKTINER